MLIAQSDKMAALMDYYTSVLGSVVTMSLGFDLQALYSEATRADGNPLIAPFSEGKVK